MDTLLVNGDYYTDSRGLPVAIEEDNEFVQRALIRLNSRRGALYGEPLLGSELHRLRGAQTQTLGRLALSYVQEALSPMAEASVEEAVVLRGSRDSITVHVTLLRGGQLYHLEVDVY